MYYKLRCNSTQFVIYYKLRNYYKLQRNIASSNVYLYLKLVRTPLKVLLRGHFLNYLSIYTPITSDECHAWFHLNASSSAARNMEQVNITKKIVHGKIRTTSSARPPDYKPIVITTRPQLTW